MSHFGGRHTTPSLTISGTASDASGIRTLTIGGVPALSSDGFAHWTVTLTNLRAGLNDIPTIATDMANPSNTSSGFIEITGAVPRDSNGNGLPDDWESVYGITNGPHGSVQASGVENLTAYALGMDPTAIDRSLLPSIGASLDPDDQLQHLTFTYRRRTDTLALTYTVQISANLTTWTDGSASLEPVGDPVANADGVTETVTVRLRSSIQGGGTQYLRLQVVESP